jgi:hypothetical protein
LTQSDLGHRWGTEAQLWSQWSAIQGYRTELRPAKCLGKLAEYTGKYGYNDGTSAMRVGSGPGELTPAKRLPIVKNTAAFSLVRHPSAVRLARTKMS